MTKETKETEELKTALVRKRPKLAIPARDLLSTGSILLNLALSDSIVGGVVKGEYTFLVGDSNSGKSFVSMAMLAEASISQRFKDYRLIYDDSEGGMKINVPVMFGQKLADRIEPPLRDKKGNPQCSRTLEDFYYRLDDAFNAGKPFIWIMDSMDSLVPQATLDLFNKNKSAHAKGKEASASYGTEKAKINSDKLRVAVSKLKDTGSILVILGQSRDNIGFGSQFNPKTRSGGNALSFYACTEIWSSIRQKLTKTVKGNTVQTGILSKFKVARSRLNGKQRTVELPIYWNSGIDDVGSMIEYLLEWGHWKTEKKGKGESEEGEKKKKGGGKINVPEWKALLSLDELVTKIHSESRERELIDIVKSVWDEVEEASVVPRKNKYQ